MSVFDDHLELFAEQNQPAPNVATALVSRDFYTSPRLQAIISQCQTDDEIERELWEDFEVHRRRADRYLNDYLDCLQLVYDEGRITEVDDSTEENPEDPYRSLIAREFYPNTATLTEPQWDLKISFDKLNRDLLAMQETLELLKRREPRGKFILNNIVYPVAKISVAATFHLGLLCRSYNLWRDHYYGVAACWFGANIIPAGSYYSWMRNGVRPMTIGGCQQKVLALYTDLKRRQLNERNRRDLQDYSLSMGNYI
ncbi:hypothetical protein J3F84DRAFT_369672 [Trichoderma pleuroticola]